MRRECEQRPLSIRIACTRPIHRLPLPYVMTPDQTVLRTDHKVLRGVRIPGGALHVSRYLPRQRGMLRGPHVDDRCRLVEAAAEENGRLRGVPDHGLYLGTRAQCVQN